MLDNIEFTLHLIRHGESEVNARPDEMGQLATTPLTALGRKQASLLHKKFQLEFECFDFIYSSPYARAHDTAKIAKGDSAQEIILVDELREYDAGDWTGASRSATLTPEVKLRMGYMDSCFLPPNGESLHMVERRATQWLEDKIIYNKKMIELSNWKKENRHPPLNIAIFSHGMTIKCLLHYVLGFDKNLTWKVSIDNTSVSKLSFNKEGWRIHSINDRSHFYV